MRKVLRLTAVLLCLSGVRTRGGEIMFISRLSDRPLPFGVTNAVSLSLVIYFAGQMLNIEKNKSEQ